MFFAKNMYLFRLYFYSVLIDFTKMLIRVTIVALWDENVLNTG